MSENYYPLSLSAAEIDATLLGSVRFDTGQTLSNADKARARQNIGAGSEATGFQILGYYDTLQDLIDALQVLPQPGDAYGIGTEPPYDIYVYDGATDTWLDTGPLDIAEFIDDNDVSSILTWSSQKISDELADKQAAITAVGMLKGSGTAVSAATLGSDYTAIDDTLSTSTTKTYSIDKIKSLEPTGIVHYDQAQTLTDTQAAQARSNIKAAREWTLVWTNNDPTATFLPQKMSFDTTHYEWVKIEYRYIKTSTLVQVMELNLSSTRAMLTGIYSGRACQRVFETNWVSSDGITCDVGSYFSSYGGGGTTDNSYCIPERIWAR